MNTDPYKIRKELDKKLRESIERYDKLPEEEKKFINDNEDLLTQKVKKMLDNINYDIISITTAYSDDFQLKDSTSRKIYNTVFMSLDTLFAIGVVTNAETMEMLYVQTRPMKYMTINEFFKIEDN